MRENFRKKLWNKKQAKWNSFQQIESLIFSYYSTFDCSTAFELSASLIARLPSTGHFFNEEINELKSINLKLFSYCSTK